MTAAATGAPARLPRPALRRLARLARAALARRAVRARLRLAAGAGTEHLLDVLGLAWDDARWLVASWSRDEQALYVLDLGRLHAVRATRIPAAPPPPGFDAAHFARRRYLDPAAGPSAWTRFELPRPLAPLAPALVPACRGAPGRRGPAWFRVLATRPPVVRALAASVGAGAVYSAPSTARGAGMATRRATARDERATAQVRPDAAAVRVLKVVHWLLDQEGPVTAEQWLRRFAEDYRGKADAVERKFTRDKQALGELGYVLHVTEAVSREEPATYVIHPRESRLPKLEFDETEARVLWLAGRGALRFSDHPLRDDLESALRKLVLGTKGLPPRATDDEELADEPGSGPEAKRLATLIAAWRSRTRIRIDYWRAATGEVTTRDVDVHGFALRRGEWIFVGYCHRRKAARIFYLSRVRALATVKAAEVGVRPGQPMYPIPADFDVRRWSRQRIWDYDVHEPVEAAVRFTRSLAPIAAQLLPGGRIATEPSGARVVTLPGVRNLRGLVRQALAWGPEAEVRSPPRARELAREILASAHAAEVSP